MTTSPHRKIITPWRVRGIEWDDVNRGHLREHGRCTERQVEDIVRARCYPTRRQLYITKGGEQRAIFQGRTCRGRYLVVPVALKVGNVARPLTCWPLSGKKLERYEAWRRSQRTS